ncbi:vanadium-dependent haloperoxidase [Actinokineospora sp.]|uniref:vanadium-dependent haloperoxidase n=1 Tax=Actinokineospora sp. TaxID=1872133 RepID=UPI0040377466
MSFSMERGIKKPSAEAAAATATSVGHVNNGEENTYPDYLGNFTKGLPHNEFGEVDRQAYRQLLRALASGANDEFERIPLDTTVGGRKYVNPQAGLVHEAVGPDSRLLTMPPAPRMDSPRLSAEACELYWMALCRDVPFARLAESDLAAAAVADLNRLTDYRAYKRAGRVEPDFLFRGDTPGDRRGPYLSQFLWKDIQFGTYRSPQRQDTVAPDRDYMTTYDTWLRVQRGWNRTLADGDRDRVNTRYLATPRDLAHWVHFDAGPTPAQAFFNAGLILSYAGVPTDAGNPYRWSKTQEGFSDFGTSHLLALVTEVANRALRAVWFQKWFVHRRSRPEAFSGLVHNHITGRRSHEFIDQQILNSDAVTRTHDKWGSYLLPQAFPEGSPMHPAYGAGHATAAAACATILKAWYDETALVPDPVRANDQGTELVPYRGGDALTVGGELTKLAANIAVGRNMAGVHWRTDFTESATLGEHLAIELLREQKPWFNETHWFSVTRFDGTSVTI